MELQNLKSQVKTALNGIGKAGKQYMSCASPEVGSFKELYREAKSINHRFVDGDELSRAGKWTLGHVSARSCGAWSRLWGSRLMTESETAFRGGEGEGGRAGRGRGGGENNQVSMYYIINHLI